MLLWKYSLDVTNIWLCELVIKLMTFHHVGGPQSNQLKALWLQFHEEGIWLPDGNIEILPEFPTCRFWTQGLDSNSLKFQNVGLFYKFQNYQLPQLQDQFLKISLSLSQSYLILSPNYTFLFLCFTFTWFLLKEKRRLATNSTISFRSKPTLINHLKRNSPNDQES